MISRIGLLLKCKYPVFQRTNNREQFFAEDEV